MFFGRLLRVIRTFISVPAGFAAMPAFRFGVYAVAGCLLWTAALGVDRIRRRAQLPSRRERIPRADVCHCRDRAACPPDRFVGPVALTRPNPDVSAKHGASGRDCEYAPENLRPPVAAASHGGLAYWSPLRRMTGDWRHRLGGWVQPRLGSDTDTSVRQCMHRPHF